MKEVTPTNWLNVAAIIIRGIALTCFLLSAARYIGYATSSFSNEHLAAVFVVNSPLLVATFSTLTIGIFGLLTPERTVFFHTILLSGASILPLMFAPTYKY